MGNRIDLAFRGGILPDSTLIARKLGPTIESCAPVRTTSPAALAAACCGSVTKTISIAGSARAPLSIQRATGSAGLSCDSLAFAEQAAGALPFFGRELRRSDGF